MATEQAGDRALALDLDVPGEHRLAGLVEDPAVRGQVAVPDPARLAVALGPLALLVHQPAELRLVDREPLLGGHLQGQVDREAVGVVQFEGARAPLRVVSPRARTSLTVASKIVVPVRSVSRKAASSLTAYREIRS